jgi:hypothetical protein
MWDTVTGGISYTSGNVDVSSGNLGVSGDITAPRIRLTATNDLSLTSSNHAFQIGPSTGVNLGIDGNEIMARSNGATATLHLNLMGGKVNCGANLEAAGNVTGAQINSSGTGGISFSSYGGGWYMSDASWVRSKSNKAVYNGSTSANAFTTPGDFTAGYSDMRLKTHKGMIKDALDKVCTLDGFYYERNERAIELGYTGGELRVGLSAQQVKEVLPEIIKSAPVNIDHGTDYMTLDYERVVPLLVEAIKELKEEVEELKNGTTN